MAVRGGQLRGVVVDDLPHAGAGEVAVGEHADLEEHPDLRGRPVADAVAFIRRDVGYLAILGPDRVAGHFLVLAQGAQQVAWRVALAAVAEVAHEVGTAVPVRIP